MVRMIDVSLRTCAACMSSKFGPAISSSFVFARTAVLALRFLKFFPEYSITCVIVGRVVLEGMIARAPACSRLFAFVRVLFCDVLHLACFS